MKRDFYLYVYMMLPLVLYTPPHISEAEFIQSLLSTGRKRLASQFNFTYRYIDDVLSINNPDFENYLGQMYPPELEIKDTTESNTSASYLDLLLVSGLLSFEHPSVLLFLLLESVYCFICGHRRVAVARYRMICLVLANSTYIF